MNKNNEISRKPLNLRERIEIEHNYRYGEAVSNIAKLLNRHRSTIYREIDGRPRVGRGKYCADIAHRKALERITNRGNNYVLDINEELYEYVVVKLKIGWSPEQISIRLPIDFPNNEFMRISHESIYTYIYSCIGSNGKSKKGYDDLRIYLPRRHKRRTKKGFRKAQKADRRANLPSIEMRPEIVDERKSGIVFFGKTIDGTAVYGDGVLIDKLSSVPSKYRKTLTRDNGSENVNFEYVQDKLGLVVYYAHPYHSWERGSNENCNGLLRRFFPKGTDFSKITDEELSKAEYLINTRPRKRFGGLTPAEVFYQETGVALIP